MIACAGGRPSKSVVRALIKAGALPFLPRGEYHDTRAALLALDRVADGLFYLRAQQSAAATPHRNFSNAEAWDAWTRRHPHALAARAASASRLASRAAHRGQGDLFTGFEGGAI